MKPSVVDADALGDELMLLIDGANARVLVEGDVGAAARARRVVELLVAHAEAAHPADARRPEPEAGQR